MNRHVLYFLGMAGIVLGLARERTLGADVPAASPSTDTPARDADSFKYYGPGGLGKTWDASQRLGRDTWIFWTWGNQKFLRKVAVLAGNQPVPISVDFFRTLDSRRRGTRFRDLGLINEPNCEQNNTPDRYGFFLDTWKGDPLKYYPVPLSDKPEDAPSYALTYAGTNQRVDTRQYGRPTGVLGLRLFPNPRFAAAQWSAEEYFRNPARVEPPYLVGFSCAFCHMGFNPLNPPKDPEHPRWENLAANIGNQYLREGELFLGRGRLLFGDKHPLPAAAGDPYQTMGLTEEDFLYQYAATQQPGTSETSRISYDFINNPNTINPLFNLAHRPYDTEQNPAGKPQRTWHILKDGADSIGIKWALMRVPINIGCEGEYWLSRLFDPVSGRRQRPFRIAEVLAGLPAAEHKDLEDRYGLRLQEVSSQRLAELRSNYSSKYGQERFGADWEEAWRRSDSLAAYLLSYPAAHLKDAVPVQGGGPDEAQLTRGKEVFAEHCARCHSSKQPDDRDGLTEEQRRSYYRQSVLAKDFLENNYLADDRRYAVTEIGTNMARALATNAVDGDIWAEFSSRHYKALPPVGRVALDVPVFAPDAALPWGVKNPIHIEFEPPGGGRGYYRTPSLVSLWATAPYLHNNAVGDYYVVWGDKARGTGWVSNDGTRWRARKEDPWQRRPQPSAADYRIDVSVAGRLQMFQDGMETLLYPARRDRWVKRTSSVSTFIPDLEHSIQQLLAAMARDVIRRELTAWLAMHQVPPELASEAARAADAITDKVVQSVLQESRVSLRFAWAAIQMRLRDHADRLFEWVYEDLRTVLADKFKNRKLPFDQLRPVLRQAFLAELDRLDQRVREAAILKVPAGMPVNLYANLNNSALLYAVLAHVRYRNDPRGLAEALLQLSDCPDLVEDSGHRYGADLSEAEKQGLITFLRTF
jgi:hypothetical protein